MAPFLILLLFASTSYADINSDLIEAARVGATAKVKQLLKQGADVNAENSSGEMRYINDFKEMQRNFELKHEVNEKIQGEKL